MPRKDPEFRRQYDRERGSDNRSQRSKQRRRLAAIYILGGKCNHCAISDPVVLNVDHVNDDGATEREVLDSTQICTRIVSGQVDRSRYQLLCCNCNWRKEYFRRTGLVDIKPPMARMNQHEGKIACLNGHPFNGKNTYVKSDGSRMCKTCNLEAQRRYAKRKRQTE
jgi:hypothetical protein